ncbi:MAG: 4-hydroxy-tetrahydrodipicolinate reductase [Clostridia bacterium]|nr:4-hydroxy-tetrahydrodipicolinate reductase [Clostridia bacterium]MBP3422920.1 4-hydroxy-tetrahydrodipicolinate reductase [Clostridia bacterium]
MTKIIICGACGKMGGNVLELLKEDKDAVAVCGVDLYPREIGIPVYKSFSEIQEDADVIIDFSSPTGLKERLDYAKNKGLGIVLAATGFTEDDLAMVHEYAKEIPLFKTANLSVGINVMQLLVKLAASRLEENYDVEIIEKHHNLKKDAPSGTALMLANTLLEVSSDKYFVNGREGMVGARDKKEIGIHAVRGGTIVGEHEVMFAGEDEIITITHSARSKKVFAVGAIRAAKFLKEKAPSIYDMQDLLTAEL